jgi:hypothetical protein
MKRFAIALLLACTASLAHAATRPFKGEAGVTTYSGYFDDGVKVDAAAVAGAAGWYEFTDAAMDAANVAAGVRSCVAYTGVNAASLDPEADDAIAYLDGIRWNGTVVVDAMGEILTDTGTTLPASLATIPTAAEIWSAATRVLTAATNITSDGAAAPTAAQNAAAVASTTPPEEFFENAPEGGGGGGGESQPRINKPPAARFTLDISDRSDGTYKAKGHIPLTPGQVRNIAVGVRMNNVYGSTLVKSVGEPEIITEGVDLTATELGPHDTIGMAQLGGEIAAGETITVKMLVTMDTGGDGEAIDVYFDVKAIGL